jgi:amino acid transporter
MPEGYAQTVAQESGEKRVFLREATGLVREMKGRDALFINFLNMSIGLGVAWVIFWGPGIYPGANVPLGLLLAAIGCVFGMFCFATLTSVMPRSGGDYVFVSRTLHPSLGFMSNWMWVIWNVVWCAILGTWVVTWGLRDLVGMLGVLSSNSGLVSLSAELTNPANPITFSITALVVILSGVMMALGLKLYLRVQAVCAILGLLMLVIAAVVFASTSNSVFQAQWNHYAVLQGAPNYASTITNAADDYVSSPIGAMPFGSWTLTLGIMPIGFWTLAYPYFSAFMGGELKRAKRTAFIGNMGGVLIGALFVIGVYMLVVNTVGENFIIGTYAQFYGYSTTAYTMPTQWFDFYPAIITGNSVVAFIMGIGMIGWLLMYPALSYLGQTRSALAWSFDRLIPAWFGKVSERWHTPVNAIIFFTIVNCIYLVFYALTFSYQQSFSAQVGQMLGTFLFVGLAAIVLPFRKRTKPIYDASGVAWKIGPIPIVTIAGIVWVIFDLLCLFYFVIDPNLGANDAYSKILPGFSLYLTLGISVFAFAYYWIIKYVRKRQGIDISLAFKELPPE